jgi:hypothetical protein
MYSYVPCFTVQNEFLIYLGNFAYLFISMSMPLQPFVGPWPPFSFLIFYTVGRTPWTGDQPIA